MRTFFDSSAFAKRYVEESGSQDVEDACRQATDLAVSILCTPEIISALNRRVREKALNRHQYLAAKSHLSEDLRDAFIINLTPSVVHQGISLLESNPLRTLDALHLACALEWHADLFVSSDRRQLVAAKEAGLKTRGV
jgi:predicted nucleic acid-binding protein